MIFWLIFATLSAVSGSVLFLGHRAALHSPKTGAPHKARSVVMLVLASAMLVAGYFVLPFSEFQQYHWLLAPVLALSLGGFSSEAISAWRGSGLRYR